MPIVRNIAALVGALLLSATGGWAAPTHAEPAPTPAPGSPPALPPGEAAPTVDDAILVTGQRRDARAEQIFVDAVTTPARNRQLARFADPACPISFGLEPADAERLVLRMRRIASAVGMRVGGDDCRANAVLLIVADRAQAIAYWRRHRPDFFSGLTRDQIDDLATGDAPVAAWQIVMMKGAGRRPIGTADSDSFDYYVVPEATPYRLGSQVEFEFFGALVLIEAAAIGDASLVQLADYAAMRVFAATNPEGALDQKLPTILSLFANTDAPAPLSVTEHDLNYLTALYKTQIASRADDQQRAMARSMSRKTAGSDTPPE